MDKLWHYFEIALNCIKCQKPFAFVIKLHNREEAFNQPTREFNCPRCNCQAQHPVVDVFELDLSHLEEYIKFSGQIDTKNGGGGQLFQ